MARRLGILGGSFDPIHLGHLRSAEEVRETLALDLVYFVPAHEPPHKPQRQLASGRDRLAMAERAIADNPAFRVSAIEIERGGVSYSVDTLAAFAARESDATLFFVLGIDAFREMQTWKDVVRVFELANVAVTSRPPHAAEPSIEHLPVAAREAFCYDPATLSFRHRTGTTLQFLPITGIDVSATAVRERARRGSSIRYLVPSSVERYVREHRLYRSGEANT
ncbi:MAG: nicotinate-nucleotide adenylyltransferase [Deltaproteobacteria bacterium]|nr:nicotinate-nucleotide adenylyltransferase [Deltaproteobacteria bacterium]